MGPPLSLPGDLQDCQELNVCSRSNAEGLGTVVCYAFPACGMTTQVVIITCQ